MMCYLYIRDKHNMNTTTLISKETEIHPSDIIRNADGHTYKIDCYYGSNTNYRIYPYEEGKPASRLYLFISKDSLVNNGWEKLT